MQGVAPGNRILPPKSSVSDSRDTPVFETGTIVSMPDTDYHIISGPPEHFDPREVFVLQLALALHRYGTPAHRLEQTMTMIMERLGLQGEFFALPTSIFASFGRPEAHRTSMMRGETGDVNLEKLSLLDELAEKIILREVTIHTAKQQLDEITGQPNRYGGWISLIGSGLGTAIAARIFGGGWREIVVAGAIGVLLGILGPFFVRQEARRRVFEIVAALCAAALAVAAAHFFSPFSVFVATLAGLILLIPGMRLTTAMTEIASGHLVSGAARLTGAVMAFLGIAFGTALGNRVADTLFETFPTAAPLPLPDVTLWISVLLFPVAVMIGLQGRPRDFPLIAGGAFIAFVVARLGTGQFGPELGAFIGAITLGICANLLSRLFRRPSAVLIAPGLILLVPGSIGYRSLTTFMEQDVVAGIELAFNVAIIGIAIVTGLLLANVLLPPKRAI